MKDDCRLALGTNLAVVIDVYVLVRCVKVFSAHKVKCNE